jgi:hypothetical protein
MAGAADFVKQVREQEGYWLNYPPGLPIGLGTIVVREGGIWVPIGQVTDHGVAVEAATDPGEGAQFTSQSQSGVTVEASTTLDPGVLKYLTAAELGARVSFEGSGKYLLSLDGVKYDRIKSIESFWTQVKLAYSVWKWDRSHRVVTSVVRADSGTFLASSASSASYELKADASVSIQGLQAAHLATGFSLVSTASSSRTFVGLKDVTPMFRLHKVTLLRNLDPAAVAASDQDTPETAATMLEEDDTPADP